MGHTRIGHLPKTHRWRGVVRLLDQSPDDVAAVAGATVWAAQARLSRLSGDPSLTHCFWLLTRLASTSREPDFEAALGRIGLAAPESGSALAFISLVSDRVRADLAAYPESGHFSELASLALRRALSETVGLHGRSLFGSSVDDVQQAFREHSTPKGFGELSRRFFGDFLARTLRSFVERELSNNVGSGHRLTGIDDSRGFAGALDLYSRQSARIVEQFASDWYSKHSWESAGQISREEAQGFVAVALRKLRRELARAEP